MVSTYLNHLNLFIKFSELNNMADIEEKIAAVFDLFDKHGNELYIGTLHFILSPLWASSNFFQNNFYQTWVEYSLLN